MRWGRTRPETPKPSAGGDSVSSYATQGWRVIGYVASDTSQVITRALGASAPTGPEIVATVGSALNSAMRAVEGLPAPTVKVTAGDGGGTFYTAVRCLDCKHRGIRHGGVEGCRVKGCLCLESMALVMTQKRSY